MGILLKTKWLRSQASETCSLSLKVRALNHHALASDSTEHLMLTPDSGHTLGHRCRAQPLIGGLLISCMIYCRTYGCCRVLASLYPHLSIQNIAQSLALYHQHTQFRSERKLFRSMVPAPRPSTRKCTFGACTLSGRTFSGSKQDSDARLCNNVLFYI